MQAVATTSNCGLKHFAECYHPNSIVQMLADSQQEGKVRCYFSDIKVVHNL